MSIASGPVTVHHWKSLSSLHPPFSFTLMRYALSLLFSRLNSLTSQPLLRSTVLRKNLKRTSKWWSVWGEAGVELSEWLQRGSVSVTELGAEGKLETPLPTISALPASCLWEDNHGFTEQGERGNIWRGCTLAPPLVAGSSPAPEIILLHYALTDEHESRRVYWEQHTPTKDVRKGQLYWSRICLQKCIFSMAQN